MNYYGLGMPARAPRHHQLVGQILAMNLWHTLDRDLFLPLHEANVDDGDGTSLAPDVTVFDLATGSAVVAVEIELASLASIINRARYVAVKHTTLKELFYIRYQPVGFCDSVLTEVVKFRIGRGVRQSTTKPSFSDILKTDIVQEALLNPYVTTSLPAHDNGLAGLFS